MYRGHIAHVTGCSNRLSFFSLLTNFCFRCIAAVEDRRTNKNGKNESDGVNAGKK